MVLVLLKERISRLLLTLGMIWVLVLVACAPEGRPPLTTGKKVVVTLFPLYDFTRQIAGGRVTVELLLPPGVEAHGFEPRPGDVAKIQSADVFVYTGPVMERWADGMIKGLDKSRLKVVDASRGVGIEGGDPHIWLDFANAAIMVENIAAALAEVDPESSSLYWQRASAYKTDLEKLDERYRQALAGCRYREIVYAGHFALGYLARRYSLAYISAYPGLMADAEPTPKRLAKMVDFIRAKKISWIFAEEMVDPKVARAVARETGAQILPLHAAHNVTREEKDAGVTFKDLMEKNLEALVKGLSCR